MTLQTDKNRRVMFRRIQYHALEWPLCEYLHRDDGLSNDDEWDVWHKERSHMPLGDHLNLR